MQIEIKIDKSRCEPRIIIETDQITDEIQEIISKLSNSSARMLTGFRENTLEILNRQEILRIYAQSGKVLAATTSGEYTLRFRLYELEQRLDPTCFVRISNSEIINLKKVKGFDLTNHYTSDYMFRYNFPGRILYVLDGTFGLGYFIVFWNFSGNLSGDLALSVSVN